MTIIANTIWAGALPYGFRFFGAHVVAELAVEILLIWLLLQKRLELRSVSLRVVIANVISFFIGTLVLIFFSAPKESLLIISLLWFLAFFISWVLEAYIFKYRMKNESKVEVWRATFWGNVASYTIAFIIFLVHIRGGDVPGLFVR